MQLIGSNMPIPFFPSLLRNRLDSMQLFVHALCWIITVARWLEHLLKVSTNPSYVYRRPFKTST